MAQINGSFSDFSTSIFKPYVVWTVDSQDQVANTSEITATLYFAKYNSGYSAFNTGGFGLTFRVNTSQGYTETFDLRSGTVPEIESIRQRTVTVAHNSDGTKSIVISASGDTESLGTISLSSTVVLPTIPREAYVTNAVDFVIGTGIPLTITNAGNFYVKAELYVNGTLIRTENLGQVTSATLTPDSGEIDDMYAEIPNATSCAMYVRLKTYSDAGYSVQIGGNKDKSGTASINQTTNKPTFADFDVANLDKTVNVIDPYGDTVISSSTSTLLGSDAKMIKGVSKLRATVTVSDKAIALNSATMSKYRFVSGAQVKEENYSSGSDVDLDIDNATSENVTVSALDSRSLSTTVNKALSYIANYVNVALYTLEIVRDNSVDALSSLSFTGQMFKEYFGGGVAGVQNAILTHYRFKPTTREWGALNGTATISIATPGVVSKTAHGFTTGDVIHFTTTGALPTGLSVNTNYFVIYNDANSFWLATTYANAIASTKINTSGTQSGVHTIHGESAWTSLTATVDGGGAISFTDYINGNLGASGFSTDKSFDIQVRIYDKLSVTIMSVTLSRGIPLIDYTQQGFAVNSKYDDGLGGDIQTPTMALAGTLITATGSELNHLDGILSDVNELNITNGGDTTEKVLNVNCKCRAWLNQAQNNTTSGSNVKVLLNAETYDIGGDFDTTNSRFVAPVSGYYLITASVAYQNGVADKRYGASIYVNGVQATLALLSVGSDGTVNPAVHIHDIHYVTAGQYIELYSFHADGTSGSDLNPLENRCFMSVHLLSV